MARWVIGVDVGGTFTDFAARETSSGVSIVHKRPSTPDDPSRAILLGLQELQQKAGILDKDIDRIAHGTTVATNALLQRKGARVAVATTAGFRDLLEIGRQVRPLIYDLQVDAPAALADRHNRLELRERIAADGTVVTPLTVLEIDKFLTEFKTLEGIESLAICCLFSFLNPAHEQQIAAAVRRECPDIYVSVSSEVQPEFREYERFSTTLINAFLQPEVSRYMERLQAAITKTAAQAKFGIFQSSGGLMSIERAAKFPVRTALSGPAAGAVGAAAAAGLSGVWDVLTLDMGGTSTDVCLIQDGKAAIANMRDIAGFRIRLPLVDIHTVGAGGGSIAHIGRDGLMKVGPESAGAIPGPACYGMGGTEPTVSDANVFLGRLPTSLAGGGLMIDPQKAAVAIEKIAADLDIEPVRAALGIAGIVTSNMTRAIRAVSVERGHDPRQFTLMPFGGAGGLHAADVARSLDIKRVLIPHAPGILCADGLLDSDLQENFVLTCRSPLSDALPQIQTVAEAGFTMAEKWLEQEAADAGAGRIFLSLDMRYIGQNYELPVQIFAGSDMLEIGDIEAMKAQFIAAHQRSYGHADPHAAIEIVNVRVKVVAALSQTVIDRQAPQGTVASMTSSHVWFSAAEPHITPVYQREDLPVGTTLAGPVIITQFDATTVVPPWAEIWVDAALNLVMEIEDA